MNKISNESAYKLIRSGYSLPNTDRYEDSRMYELVQKQVEAYNTLDEILTKIRELANFHNGYSLEIDTDDDYQIDFGDGLWYSQEILFHSLEELKEAFDNCKIVPEQDYVREVLQEAIKALEKGQSCFDYNSNLRLTIYRL